MNMMEQHFGDRTPQITINESTPMMNSLPFHYSMITNKKIKKGLRTVQHSYQSIMNVAYEKPQAFQDGEVVVWCDQFDEYTCTIIGSYKGFVKGKWFWFYTLVIKD